LIFTPKNSVLTTCPGLGPKTHGPKYWSAPLFTAWDTGIGFIKIISPANPTWFSLDITRLFLFTAASGTYINAATAEWYQKPTKSSGNQNGKAMLPEINEILDNCERPVGKFS